MSSIRPGSEYLLKDNTVGIQDLQDAVKNTEAYRSLKVVDLRIEHTLVIQRIQDIKEQKAAYLRKISILTNEDDPLTLTSVIYNNDLDTGSPSLSSDLDVNKAIMIRTPSNPILNYVRKTFTDSIAEIDIRLRDYEYHLLKLAQQEQKIVYYINQLMSAEATAQVQST
jgi:hypothetical protein